MSILPAASQASLLPIASLDISVCTFGGCEKRVSGKEKRYLQEGLFLLWYETLTPVKIPNAELSRGAYVLKDRRVAVGICGI